MIRWCLSVIANLFLPRDALFKARPKSQKLFDGFVIVELGAYENSLLNDQLFMLQNDKELNIETRGKALQGLRIQSLAMSLRTRRGRIPYDYQKQTDLIRLARYPYSQIIPVLDEVSALSDIPWLSPTEMLNRQGDEGEEAESDVEEEVDPENP